MSLTTARVKLIRHAFTAAGARLPKAVEQATHDYDKLVSAAEAFPAPSDQDIQEAIAACMLEDRDPLEDDQVRRLATARTLVSPSGRSVAYGVPQAAERRLVAALVDCTDDILAALHKAADKAGQSLAAAHAIIGDNDLNDSEPILRLGPDAARAWAEARDAATALEGIHSAWAALAELTGFASSSVDPVLRLADIDLDQYDQLGRTAKPWDIVRAGATIDLADRHTIRERTDRIVRAKQDRQNQPAEQFRGEFRRLRGMGVA